MHTQKSPIQRDWPTGPNVQAEAAIVMESSTGLVLYEKYKFNSLSAVY